MINVADLVVTPVCELLPRPAEGAVDWTLVFGCDSQRREVRLTQVSFRGNVQLVDVVQTESSPPV